MSGGVWEQVVEAARVRRLPVITAAEYERLAATIAARYLAPPPPDAWWERLRPPRRPLQYGGGNALELLASQVGERDDVLLIVTGGRPQGQGAVRGTTSALIDVVRDSPEFALAMAPEDLSWLALDTGQGALLFGGAPPG